MKGNLHIQLRFVKYGHHRALETRKTKISSIIQTLEHVLWRNPTKADSKSLVSAEGLGEVKFDDFGEKTSKSKLT